MKPVRLSIGITIALLLASPLFADMFTLSHSCMKPYKPYEFDSQWEYDNFISEVDRYKACISDFVDEHSDAVRRHHEAAEEAIDEWNNFVNYELN